jgi:hypothetical protein
MGIKTGPVKPAARQLEARSCDRKVRRFPKVRDRQICRDNSDTDASPYRERIGKSRERAFSFEGIVH